MCDKCDLDLAMYGEPQSGFRCSDVTAELLAEEANGIARFPNRGKAAQAGEVPDGKRGGPGTKTDSGR